MIPNEAMRTAARFALEYEAYRVTANAVGRTPVSRELIVEEARRSPTLSPLDVLRQKRRSPLR